MRMSADRRAMSGFRKSPLQMMVLVSVYVLAFAKKGLPSARSDKDAAVVRGMHVCLVNHVFQFAPRVASAHGKVVFHQHKVCA